MNKLCKEYISEIKALFPIKRKEERDYIKKIIADVEDYCEEANVTTKQELYENYGKPNDVVNNYFSTVDTEYIAKQISTKRLLKTFVIGLLVLATVLTSAFCITLYAQFQMVKRTEAIGVRTYIIEYN
ncbi:MAG: hypothetical protein IJD93_03360 [Ruminococcus sp.]|nr:hypothetical protein [Ruminococcus sp.]